MDRHPVGTRLRFEIFKRDGFRCVYCGATPVQAALHVDHVIPVVEGGTNDPANLATACGSCNLGKGGAPLERRKLAPAVAIDSAEDHAEQIRQYLAAQKEIEAAREELVELIADSWEQSIGRMSQDMFDRLRALSIEWPLDQLIEAVSITGRKMGRPGSDSYDGRLATKQAKYFHGILRRWREQAQLTSRDDTAPEEVH